MEIHGFTPSTVFFLLSNKAVVPINPNTNQTDINFNGEYTYVQPAFGPNPITTTSQPFGNPYIPTFAANATFSKSFPNWLADVNNKLDLRGFYLTNCGNVANSINGYCQIFDWPTSFLTKVSPISGSKIAFSTETIFYAQSSYFVTIVMVQWSNIFACKSRKVYLFHNLGIFYLLGLQ